MYVGATHTAAISRSTLPAARSAGARKDSEVLRVRPARTSRVRGLPRPLTHLNRSPSFPGPPSPLRQDVPMNQRRLGLDEFMMKATAVCSITRT